MKKIKKLYQKIYGRPQQWKDRFIQWKMHYYKEEIVHTPNTIPIKILTDLFCFVETCANSKLCIKIQRTDDSQNLEEQGINTCFTNIKNFKSFSN